MECVLLKWKHNWTNKKPRGKERKSQGSHGGKASTSLGWRGGFMSQGMSVISDGSVHSEQDLSVRRMCSLPWLRRNIANPSSSFLACHLKPLINNCVPLEDGWMRPLAVAERGQTVMLAALIFMLRVNTCSDLSHESIHYQSRRLEHNQLRVGVGTKHEAGFCWVFMGTAFYHRDSQRNRPLETESHVWALICVESSSCV